MKITWLLVIAATWLFCNAMIGSSLDYPKISYTTDGTSVGSYQTFLSSLRLSLKSPAPTSLDFLVLRKPSEIKNENMFLQVELFYKDDQQKKTISITLALYALNSYVIGYKSGPKSFFFKEAPSAAKRLLFDGTEKKDVEVYTTYDKLADRSRIPLSTGALKKAIGILHDFDGVNVNTPLKESLVVVIQMVAEAARFKFIQTKIEENMIYGYIPKGDTISYENAWDPLSEQIQLSGSNGIFKTPVRVQNEDYTIRDITSVKQVEKVITLLLYKERRRSETIGTSVVEEEWLPVLL